MKLQFQQKIFLYLNKYLFKIVYCLRRRGSIVIDFKLTVSILKFLKNNEKNDTDHIIGFPVNQL